MLELLLMQVHSMSLHQKTNSVYMGICGDWHDDIQMPLSFKLRIWLIPYTSLIN